MLQLGECCVILPELVYEDGSVMLQELVPEDGCYFAGVSV